MVYIVGQDGIRRKYACHTCIKGHRSTRCDHKNRVLVEIKRKGRPLSQCDECRALRKTKRVHIKCKCPEPSLCSDKHTAVATNDPGQPVSLRPGGGGVQGGETPPAQTGCSRCNQLECACLSPAAPDLDTAMSPDDGFENPMTPDDIIAQHKIPPPLSSMILPPIRLPPPPPSRNRIIPIHDPTDDLDSDTPIYKSEENNTLDRVAVLGELSHTSSEELMEQIYSPFLLQSSHVRRILVNDGGPPVEADENWSGMGKSDGS